MNKKQTQLESSDFKPTVRSMIMSVFVEKY